jgi:hypothetical protein
MRVLISNTLGVWMHLWLKESSVLAVEVLRRSRRFLPIVPAGVLVRISGYYVP